MIAVFVTFDAPDLDDAVVRKVGHDHGAGAGRLPPVLAGLPPHATRAPGRDRDDRAQHDADDKPRVVFSLT